VTTIMIAGSKAMAASAERPWAPQRNPEVGQSNPPDNATRPFKCSPRNLAEQHVLGSRRITR
jgi:hypothetical protein